MPALYQLKQFSVVRVFSLPQGVFTIGRGSENHVVLSDAQVSRSHCRLTSYGRQTCVEDLRSRNGTWLCGIRLYGAHPLTNGARLQIGRTTFDFRADAESDTTDAPPIVPPVNRRDVAVAHPCHQAFHFKIRWRFSWRGIVFGWRIRRD